MKHILVDDNPFDEWLRGLGVTGWLKTLLMEGMCFVIIILVRLLVFSCVFSCLKRVVFNITNQAWLVQRKKGEL